MTQSLKTAKSIRVKLNMFCSTGTQGRLPWLATGLVMLGLVAQSGCSDPDRKTYPVRGIVRFPDDQLLRDGLVEFEIVGRKKPITATGEIGPDGSFVLGTYELSDGALAGEHRVVVIADHEIGTGAERPGMIPVSQLHPKHRVFQTSGLTQTVKPETNNLIIEVEYAPQPKSESTKAE